MKLKDLVKSLQECLGPIDDLPDTNCESNSGMAYDRTAPTQVQVKDIPKAKTVDECDCGCDECDDDLEECVDVFMDESTQEQYYIELDEETLTERKIKVRVNSKGQRIKRLTCPPGRVVKNINGRKVCATQGGQARMKKKIAIRKTNRTKKAKGAGYKKRINIKRQRALRKRKQMGIKNEV